MMLIVLLFEVVELWMICGITLQGMKKGVMTSKSNIMVCLCY